MPGLNSSMEVRTNSDPPQHSSHNHPIGGSHAAQLPVKDELGDDDEFFEDGDDDETTYKPRPQLPKPFVVMRTLAHLMRDLENGTIDVDPEYQRDVVWTADRMTGLVNSLMENFYIPPIILNKKTQAAPIGGKSHVTLVCVDGKQRLSSVRAFIKGMIPCHDHRGEKWWFCDTPRNRRKNIFPDETQKLFLSKEFVSFEFTDLSAEQEEDLFARVQMGVQLSVAEKMRASRGPWQELARLFVDDFSVIYSLMKDRARAKDFQLTLCCFSQILEVLHPTAPNGIPVLKTNYAVLPKLLSNKGAVDDGIKSQLGSVWRIFSDLVKQDSDTFTNANKYLQGVQTFAPIEMVAVTVLISMYSDTRDDQLLLGDIRALREALREHFADLRMNTNVWKFVWDFIENLENIRGAVDGGTIRRNLSKEPLRKAPATASALSGQIAKHPVKAKPASILPPRKPIAVKREEGAPTPSSNSRSSKRQRTDPSPEYGVSSVINHSNCTVTSNHFPNNNPAFRSFSSAEHTPARPLLPPPHTLNAPQISLTQTDPTPSDTTTFPWRFRPPGVPAERPTSLPTPAQVRQTRISELNNYRAPSGTMGASASVIPMSRPAPVSSMSLSSIPSVAPPNTNTPRIRPGIGAFAPSHTEMQWEGVMESISPSISQQVTTTAIAPSRSPSLPSRASTTPSNQPRSPHTQRRSVPRPMPAQLDGAIDLTSDTELEQERQDLLSSFKGRSVSSEQCGGSAAAASVPAATVRKAPMQRVPVTIRDREAEDVPTGLKPYARFKKRKD